MRSYLSLALASGLLLAAAPAVGQTRFAWPEQGADPSRYTHVEECYAATYRARELDVAQRLGADRVWSDTVGTGPRSDEERQTSVVVETARACMQRFANVDSVALRDFSLLLPLYLAAEWDDRAQALAARRIAAVPKDAEAELAAVVDTVIRTYLAEQPRDDFVRPPRIGLAIRFASEHVPSLSDRVQRFLNYARLILFIGEMGERWQDTALVRGLVETTARLADSLTTADRDRIVELGTGVFGSDGDLAVQLYAIYNMFFGRQAFLDSLRQSTAAFVKLSRENWARALGGPPESYGWGMPIGEKAPPIEAEIWLGHDEKDGPRPAPGRISLIAILSDWSCRGQVDDNEDAVYTPARCTQALIGLRRLQERFPKLDITVVAENLGHFKYLKEGVTPEREAELTKKWLESFGIRAPLALTVRDSWTLPAPDGRRIWSEDENMANYSFGKSWRLLRPIDAFLLDEDGIIIHAAGISGYDETFAELIEILLGRGRAGV